MGIFFFFAQCNKTRLFCFPSLMKAPQFLPCERQKPLFFVIYLLRSRPYCCQLTSSFALPDSAVAVGNSNGRPAETRSRFAYQHFQQHSAYRKLPLLGFPGALFKPLHCKLLSLGITWYSNIIMCISVAFQAPKACHSIVHLQTDSNQSSEVSFLSVTFLW